jgi:Ran GTPase-activating protein (RanGAP) involved in mRNA processing and transport
MLLGNNCFEDEGAKLFKSAIADNTTLEVLDLSWNNFKNKGATLLAEALQVKLILLLEKTEKDNNLLNTNYTASS